MCMCHLKSNILFNQVCCDGVVLPSVIHNECTVAIVFFQGIVRALKELRENLKEYGVSIFVRRGGPNYQEGLRVMRELGKLINIMVVVEAFLGLNFSDLKWPQSLEY